MSARIGQGAFRTAVLARWEGSCAVTGCATREAIRASHIKPWRMATNEERLDPANGLPLVATLDALFDAGLITFGDEGSLLVSGRLRSEDRDMLGLNGLCLRRHPDPATRAYLAMHRLHAGIS